MAKHKARRKTEEAVFPIILTCYMDYYLLRLLFFLFSASNGSEPGKIMVRLTNSEISFGATFYIKEIVLPIYKANKTIYPGAPTNLDQIPENGKLVSLNHKDGEQFVKFTLSARAGSVKQFMYGPFPLYDTCQVDFILFKSDTPDQVVEVFSTPRGEPLTHFEEEFSTWLGNGLYGWKARTVCGDKENPYLPYKESEDILFSGANLEVVPHLDLGGFNDNRNPISDSIEIPDPPQVGEKYNETPGNLHLKRLPWER